jgi:hypothetical protein
MDGMLAAHYRMFGRYTGLVGEVPELDLLFYQRLAVKSGCLDRGQYVLFAGRRGASNMLNGKAY